jgi:hypothetical protein
MKKTKKPRREWAAVATAKADGSDDQQAHSKKDLATFPFVDIAMNSTILKGDLLFLEFY